MRKQVDNAARQDFVHYTPFPTRNVTANRVDCLHGKRFHIDSRNGETIKGDEQRHLVGKLLVYFVDIECGADNAADLCQNRIFGDLLLGRTRPRRTDLSCGITHLLLPAAFASLA